MKTDDIPGYNLLTAEIIIEELARLGVRHFYVSPGSRSTPLTLTIARNKKITHEMHYDERGAAFAALGYGRANNQPAGLVCTSGTAAVNYFPAVVEAAMDRVPLLVLTADRPPELQDVSANQSIFQERLYGTYPRCFYNIPPSDHATDWSLLLTQIDNAYIHATGLLPGPVHLNLMFREPLYTRKKHISVASLTAWKKQNPPFSKTLSSKQHLGDDDKTVIFDSLTKSKNLLITVGYVSNMASIKTVQKICDSIDAPVFADIRSNLHGNDRPKNNIQFFDQLLLAEDASTQPLTVLHIGGVLTSKRYLTFIENALIDNYLHVDQFPYRYNPHFRVTDTITGSFSSLLKFIRSTKISVSNKSWPRKLKKIDNKIAKLLESESAVSDRLDEIAAARLIAKNIPNQSGLFLGSSMPIRDFDMYADLHDKNIKVYANRGASGIDGAIASFAGVMRSHAKGTAVIGDLSALHDLNSLPLLQKLNKPAVLIIINNNGGGIFSFLPIAGEKDIFENCFAASHALSFKNAASMFALSYMAPQTLEEFVELYHKAVRAHEPTLIEVVTDRKLNHANHLRIQNKIKKVMKTDD